MPSRTSILLLLPALALLCQTAGAQSFSYDGNRWYEIEVSIFSNEGSGSSNELLIPDKTRLTYPEPIRMLEPAAGDYMLDFAADRPPEPFLPDRFPDEQGDTEEDVFIGPPEAPGETTFRLTDFSRDPYIALGEEQAEFSEYNRDIERSPDHRLLFHAVWRQPLLNRAQATAIYVAGGEQYGRHFELEGSLRFSYNVNRVDAEANLWLSEFSAFPVAGFDASRWRLPAPPFQTGDPSLTLDLPVTRLEHMKQERPMTSNELHYLDHPGMGMLVQIRPYQLPQPEFSFE